jgi:hypothetical protein
MRTIRFFIIAIVFMMAACSSGDDGGYSSIDGVWTVIMDGRQYQMELTKQSSVVSGYIYDIASEETFTLSRSSAMYNDRVTLVFDRGEIRHTMLGTVSQTYALMSGECMAGERRFDWRATR